MDDRHEAPSFVPVVIDLQGEGWIPQLVARYADPGPPSTVLGAVLAEMFRRGAKSAAIEREYIDRDYRSEYSAFYSSAFRQLPSVTDRLHFFQDPIPQEMSLETEPLSFDGLNYLGYVVLRPVRAAPVGRTMLAAAPEMLDHLTCLVRERVNVFGIDFEVEGFPFIAQDAHFGVCAHADAWMIAQYHYLRFRDSPRLTPAQLTLGGSQPGKPRPFLEAGVRLPQLREMLQRASLLPMTYDYKLMVGKTSVNEDAVRYLDSGLPVILAADEHVVTAIGYRRRSGLRRPRIELIVHDDERGPYRQIGTDGINYGAWAAMIVPLPDKVWVRAKQAETRAEQAAALQLRATQEGRSLLTKIRAKRLHWRTVCVESNEFKSTLLTRGASPHVAVHYQRMPMPRWIWLVELIDPRADSHEEVIGEVLWDSTNHLRGGQVLAWRLADQFNYQTTATSSVPIRVDPRSKMLVMRPKGRAW